MSKIKRSKKPFIDFLFAFKFKLRLDISRYNHVIVIKLWLMQLDTIEMTVLYFLSVYTCDLRIDYFILLLLVLLSLLS